MDTMEKTHELENKLTRVQTDVSYLKKKMDKVEKKLESMDDKTDQLVRDLPEIFRGIMDGYVTRKEFERHVAEFSSAVKVHEKFEKRISQQEIRNKVIAIVFSVLVFILTFGEKIVEWLALLVNSKQ